MSFISMDLVGPYRETENGKQYALTVICNADQLHIYDCHKIKEYEGHHQSISYRCIFHIQK